MSSFVDRSDRGVLRWQRHVVRRLSAGRRRSRDAAYRQSVVPCELMLWDVLAAVVAGLLVTQLAIVVTTVYLHRALAHRALDRAPGGGRAVPVRDLDHDRDAAPGVGRGAPQAPRRDRHRRGPAQPARSSGSGGCSSATSVSTSGSRATTRTLRKYARDIPHRRARPARVRLRARRARRSASRSSSSAMWAARVPALRSASSRPGCTRSLRDARRARSTRSGTRSASSRTPNSATNVQPLALVTGGEGLHNNHHAAPTSARFALQRGEIDPGWWLVRDAACSCASRASATTTSSSRPFERSRPLRGRSHATARQGLRASSTVRSWSGPQNSAGAGVVTPLSM